MNKLYTQLFEKCRSKYDKKAATIHKSQFNNTITITHQETTPRKKPPLAKVPTQKIFIGNPSSTIKLNNSCNQSLTKYYHTSVPNSAKQNNRENDCGYSSKLKSIRTKISTHTLKINNSLRNDSKEIKVEKQPHVIMKLDNSNNISLNSSLNKTNIELRTSINPLSMSKDLNRASAMNPNTSSAKRINAKKIASRLENKSNLTLTISYIKEPELLRKRTSVASKLKKEPFSAFKALTQYSGSLTDYEKKEIMTYKDIYFTGADSKKIEASFALFKCNYGYDDSDADYVVVPHDHIAYRYEVVSILGKGSFGEVIKCYDHKNLELVALKIIKNQERLHYQATVELKLLKYIASKGNVEHHAIKLKHSFVFRKHLCFSTELLGPNLFEVLKANRFKGIEIQRLRTIAYQMLECLRFLKQHDIIHCDLKPENILVKDNSKNDIKVIDFGSGCFSKEQLYTYIQSRFYRAPEVILGLKYTTAIDMWSFGLILSELCKGFPLLPGENEKEQISMIIQLRGLPSASLLKKGKRSHLFFDENLKPTVGASGRSNHSLSEVINCKDEHLLDLIEKCLEWDPCKRITPSMALSQKFFQSMYQHN